MDKKKTVNHKKLMSYVTYNALHYALFRRCYNWTVKFWKWRRWSSKSLQPDQNGLSHNQIFIQQVSLVFMYQFICKYHCYSIILWE